MFGLLAGAGVALLRDRLDHVFHGPGEVRDELKVPLLGNIPFISFFEGVRRDKRFLLDQLDTETGGIDRYQRFAYQESFRNLYTSLRFLNSGHPIRSLALSSSVPAEGKSLVIILLAKTLSELGQRVLLVDADLRRPQVHQRLGLNNLEGLSTLLTDESRSWRNLLQPVADHPNWQVLTAGRRAPDPPRLLSSERMGTLVREIADSGSFDMILYDTPPALGLADASLLAEHLDGLVLVVGLNKVDRGLPAEAIERIRSAGAPLLGVVTNSMKPTPAAASYYQRGDYGYGEANEGAAALDPGSAYTYYNGGTTRSESKRSGLEKVMPNRDNIRRWNQSVRRWLQGE
jgi:capsular exopolysaccharide synthesis family protein